MDNREHILQTALRLFVINGYEGTGVQAIVDETGLSKPTIYHWFGSKRGILGAIVSQYGDELIKTMSGTAVYRGDLPASLDGISAAYFAFTMKHRQFMRMLLSMHHGAPGSESKEAVEPIIETLYRMFEKVFEDAVFDHGNMRGRSAIIAAHFFGVLNTHVFLFLDGHALLNETVRGEALRVFSCGIYT
ncbi:MAG: TetR/AcrR family transcriptional regulator [Spirochaetales bacterium]|nr:TetR/AcrR family transcriptional regulator [Spirochaetales bacterium]